MGEHTRPIGLLAAAALAPAPAMTVAGSVPAPIGAALAAAGLLLAPGYLLCAWLDLGRRLALAESPSLWFAASLAAWLPACAASALFEVGLTAATASVAALAAGFALAAAATARRPKPDAEKPAAACERRERALGALVAIAGVAVTVAAWELTASGSVDRWWYVAQARALVERGALDFADPMLGSGRVVERFAYNPWIVALAAWSRAAGADTLWIYQSAAPLLLVPLAISATVFLGRSLFASTRMAYLTALAAILVWTSATLFPIVARAPEDKFVALLILSPLLLGSVVRACGSPLGASLVVAIAIVSAVVVAVHPLVYAIALVAVGPFLALQVWRARGLRPALVAVALVVLAAASAAAVRGTAIRSAIVATGASPQSLEHPVVRVHRSRDRLLEFGDGSYIVHPRLVMHPLVLLALAGCLLVRARSAPALDMLAPATAASLAVAFVPPLTAAAGVVVLPWMVYRVLWALPLAPLVAIATDAASARTRGSPVLAATALIAAVSPWIAGAVADRARPERAHSAYPAGDRSVSALVAAVAALPRDAVVATAPELAERLPALTGRAVLAASDRATVVFAADRTLAESRLRANAAIALGLWKRADGVPDPSHLVYAPGADAERYCGVRLYDHERFVLCEFKPTAPEPGTRLYEAGAEADGERVLTFASLLADESEAPMLACEPPPAIAGRGGLLVWQRPGPWSADRADVRCRLLPHDAQATFSPRTLRVEPFLGAAEDELTISVRGLREGVQLWNVRTRVRASDGDILRFGLPRGGIDSLSLRIASSFLPFVKLSDLAITTDEVADGTAEP